MFPAVIPDLFNERTVFAERPVVIDGGVVDDSPQERLRTRSNRPTWPWHRISYSRSVTHSLPTACPSSIPNMLKTLSAGNRWIVFVYRIGAARQQGGREAPG